MKRSASPVKGKVTSAMIAPGEINTTITKGITPNAMPKPEKGKPRKKKRPQTTRPSKIVSSAMSNYLETKSSKW